MASNNRRKRTTTAALADILASDKSYLSSDSEIDAESEFDPDSFGNDFASSSGSDHGSEGPDTGIWTQHPTTHLFGKQDVIRAGREPFPFTGSPGVMFYV